MKRKLVILSALVLVMVAGYITAVKKNTLAKENMLSMINLEALAGDEWDIGGGMTSGESGGGTDECKEEKVSTTEEEKDYGKGIGKKLYRKVTTYICKGDGDSDCMEGAIYETYDVNGAYIGTTNARLTKGCKK